MLKISVADELLWKELHLYFAQDPLYNWNELSQLIADGFAES